MNPSEVVALVFGILAFGLVLAVIFGLIPAIRIRRKYKKFVLKHSISLKRLDEINRAYAKKFREVQDFKFVNSYDNKKMYENITCKDYLIYQLVDMQEEVNDSLEATLLNEAYYEQYKREIETTCELNHYDTTDLPKDPIRLFKIEKSLFNKKKLAPSTNFSIYVKLMLTNMNGDLITLKRYRFYPEDIRDLIRRINNKRGERYLDNDIWQSLCRVERGKVTNKIRFMILRKYNHRCNICGKYSKYLEIDHIKPIARGGKSTIDNLQPLCHECNVKKGDSYNSYNRSDLL